MHYRQYHLKMEVLLEIVKFLFFDYKHNLQYLGKYNKIGKQSAHFTANVSECVEQSKASTLAVILGLFLSIH